MILGLKIDSEKEELVNLGESEIYILKNFLEDDRVIFFGDKMPSIP